MNYNLVILFSFSIAIAAFIGGVRYKKINPAYFPFLLIVWLALANEILSYILARTIRNNTPNNNIYTLLETLLLFWQFRNWGLLRRPTKLYPALLIATVIAWLIEVVFINSISIQVFYFQILFSFIIVFMSIHTINGLIIRDRRSILKNPTFILGVGFVIFYTLKVLVQTFWLYGSQFSREFRINVTYTFIYVNLIANLLYALAVLWMPTKQRFTLPS